MTNCLYLNANGLNAKKVRILHQCVFILFNLANMGLSEYSIVLRMFFLKIIYEPVVIIFYSLWKVINNACATQAVLSVLMNIKSPDVQLGPTLQVNFPVRFRLDPHFFSSAGCVSRYQRG